MVSDEEIIFLKLKNQSCEEIGEYLVSNKEAKWAVAQILDVDVGTRNTNIIRLRLDTIKNINCIMD